MIWTRQQYPSGWSGVLGDETFLAFWKLIPCLFVYNGHRDIMVLAVPLVVVIQAL